MMSHEIRTPMNGVLGFANLLLDTPLSAEQREFAQTVQRSGDALLALINDVLDYSKIEAGRMIVEQIDFDLRAVCDEVSLLDEGRIKIGVTDSGIGIKPEQLDRLFQRFTQADSSTTRRYGGTGLGLAISKALVELMGGCIGAESRPGAGSTFWITLPLIAAHGAPGGGDAPSTKSPPAAAALPAQVNIAAGRGVGRVLLVEDNFVNQRVAVYMLRKLGHHVDVAIHGREAVDILSNSRYDLVLMDCQMPEMDGFEATRVIRDRTSAVLDHDVPVIAMTANAFPEDRSRSLACGMNDFLSKPVDRAVLAATLDKWLKPAQVAEPRAAVG